ncbi:MAG: hypothetical protein ACE5FU_10075, partial [Nitrospinota bacterium]
VKFFFRLPSPSSLLLAKASPGMPQRAFYRQGRNVDAFGCIFNAPPNMAVVKHLVLNMYRGIQQNDSL